MSVTECMNRNPNLLMEGALGERLKREYGLQFDASVAMASLVYTAQGRGALSELWRQYIDVARRHGLPLLATTPTRRVNSERVGASGFTDRIICDNVRFLQGIQAESGIEMYAGGLMGCRGDAYTGEGCLSEEDAEEFHKWTVERFWKAEADFLYAGIMPTADEAAGLARAVDSTELPYIISFTIQQNGKLIDGTTIADAIAYIDGETKNHPVCYMTNCVHPAILRKALLQPCNRVDIVRERFKGIQANTSALSYAELDAVAELRCSEPEEFAEEMMKLREVGNLQIWGGCCGTDQRHMELIASKIAPR